MSRVQSEGESQGRRDRKRAAARAGTAQKPHLRRMALEGLEARTLLSTLPTPINLGQSYVGSSDTVTSNQGNSSSPSVTADPLNPQKLVAAWTTTDPAHLLDGSGGQVTTYVQGAYSVDGGQTWSELPNDTAADVQVDFSIAPVTSGRQPDFAQTTDATVAFGRDESVYMLSSTHNAASTSGVLDLQKWNFASLTPTPQTFHIHSYDSLSDDSTINPIYRWQGADSAITPTLAVDSNAPSFTDGTTVQSDPLSGNVYVAWQTVDTPPTNATQNPDTIKLMSSADGGQNFTYQAYLNNHNIGDNYDSPRLAISQGGPGVAGGQVTVVYDDSGPGGTNAPYFDFIDTKADTNGGTDAHGEATYTPILLAQKDGIAAGIDAFAPTVIPIPVNVTDANFNTVSNLTVTLSLSYPTLGNTSATLTSPDGRTTVTLWNNTTNNAGQATMSPGVLSGANVGASTLTPYIGTTLDSTANRSIFDTSVAAPYTGHFRPFGNLQSAFRGRTAAQVNGTWTLTITDYRNETITPPTPQPALIGASVDITSGLSSVTTNRAVTVAPAYLNSGANALTDGIQSLPVHPDPTIASDNTLGSNSPNQGRLYLAFTNDNFNAATLAYTTSTFIELFYSDDGGTTWTFDSIVNDDNGLADGYSTGGYAIQPGSGLAGNPQLAFINPGANVRPKIEPQVAVDPDTGTVVVSFLDTRNDASAVRTADYIAASTDGGATFAPETFANEDSPLSHFDPISGVGLHTPTVDAITGQVVHLGPIPDNQSGGNGNREATFGYGQRQGLAVINGHIIPVWSSNQNGTTLYEPDPTLPSNEGSNARNQKTTLNIESAVLNFAAGPRVLSGTQGPVGEPGDTVNTARAADGSPIANTIVLTFDRGVDPTSFPADGTTNPIGTSPLEVFYNNPSGSAAPVPLRVLSVTPDSTDAVYTITFDPAGHGVGTYSYMLRPIVKGMIPYQAILSTDQAQQVPFIDTAVNGGRASFTLSGHPGVTLTTATLSGLVDVYKKGNPVFSSTDLQIYLVAQDGTRYLFFQGSTANTAANASINVGSSITIPTPPVEPLDQTYTIQVVDNVPGEQVFLYNNVDASDFNFQVKLNNQTASTITGNFLDQNGDGTPGDPSGDVYSVPTGRDSLPLIVPGPHVSSSSAVGAKGTASTGPDNLINNDDANSISVTFDRDMRVTSFTPDKILSIVGPTGRIDSPLAFPSGGISKTYAYPGPYILIPKGGTLTSTIPITSTGLKVSNLTVQVNITDPADQSLQLTLVAPDGTMVPLVASTNPAAGANFTNTTFSDAPGANGLTATIPQGGAPYSLTYQPASPLAALAGKALDGTWKLLVTDITTAGPQGRLNSWSLGVTPQIPKGAGTELDSPLVVANYPDNSFKIAHLAVQLNISSTLDSDLQVFLVAPDGTTTIPLIQGDGGTGANFSNTRLDDSSTLPISQGVAPFNLTYKPVGQLSTFNGLSIEGTWKLRILSPNADMSASTLNSWSLIATPQLTVTPVNATSNGTVARTFTIGFPTQQLSGSYNVTLSPNILSVTANPANPAVGTPLDTNLNAGVDALRGTSGGATTPEQFLAAAVPVTIPYAQKSLIGPIVPGVLNSQLSVTDNFPIQGDVGTTAGLTVSFNIIYYNDPDLTATLTAPNGRSVTLFMNVGKGSVTADFTNTTLSDTTTPLAPITAAGAPFFGTFNPEFPLSAFTTDLGGNQAFSGGLWTLKITNVGVDPGKVVDQQYPPTLLGWSLKFQKPVTNTGLGEPVADQKTVGLRLFNLAPSNPLANDTWTAVGPAGTHAAHNPNNTLGGSADNADLGGPVSVVALDPSDPSGNTAFIGAASGGVWKTNDFLTTSPGGPTYVPLTDFGTNSSINIGGIAVFGRNGDPNQSIVFAGTGDGQSTTANSGNASRGVGILRSTDGGAIFTLLDSTTNVDASGNPLPEGSPLRDHAFVGTTSYKVVVDPTLQPGGGIIVYAALGGKNGGLWRSLDGGDHWSNLSAGVVPAVNGQNAAATDVILDQASRSPTTGSLDILYAAFQGVGVFISSSRGQALTLLAGTVGADNLIQNTEFLPATPLAVNDANTPNGAFGRIVLAKPALTNNAAENTLYQDWIYAAVENANGTFRGLYVTKDRGENWTLARISSIPTPNAAAVTETLPTNDNLQANNYDVTQGATSHTHNGNSAFSVSLDPANPSIVYLGGTQDYNTSGLIRVDLTGLYDAHAFVPFANDRNDGGLLGRDALGRVNVVNINNPDPVFQGGDPNSIGTGVNYINLRHSPTDPFNINATQFVYNSGAFTNDGTGVKWTPIDSSYDLPLQGSTDIHQLLSTVDPLTGLTRLIVADDQGVFTGLLNPDGSVDTAGIGTAAAVNGSRNGNLQDEAFYQGAAQPSLLAAQAAGALFYGSGVGMADAQSDPNILTTGNLTWTVRGTAYGDLQGGVQSNNRGGVGIATDQTGGVSPSNPNGSPSVYEYDVPFLGGDTTNFFRVQNNGQTTGLVNNYPVEFPSNNVLSNGNGVSQLGQFAVNPIDGSEILISSNLGNLYETTNKGVQFLQIASGSGDFDGTYAPALAYGAPDPNAPNGIGNLNNFIYAGTVGGHIYVTRTGGGPWTSISAGLDGSGVTAIYTNPNRGSHEAYAVTLNGVYFMADSLAQGATWVNITGNLAQIQHNAFGDPALAESSLLGYGGGQNGGFRTIVADYRYAVPDVVTPTTTYPVLYVAGYGGVFRSLDNGQSWTAFPNVAFDSAPIDGGYLPNVDVTSLSLNLGAVNPATGHPTQVAGDPEVLLASTLGRGDFAIRLAPDVFPTSIHFDANLPSPGGSDSGSSNTDRVTSVLTPYIDGISEISNFGNTVTITLTDASNGKVLGTGTTDPFGRFSVQIVNDGSDPSFFQSSTSPDDKVVGIQATDSSGAKGNVTDFRYTLIRTLPATPGVPILEPKYDTGRSSSDDITDIAVPLSTPGSPPNFVAPIFDVATPPPTVGVASAGTVELYRSTSPDGPFTLVNTAVINGQPVMLSDPSLLALAQAGQFANVYYYVADQLDSAGNTSLRSGPLKVTFNNITPPTLAAPTLDPSTNSGLIKSQLVTHFTHPVFDSGGLLPNEQLTLYRMSGNNPPILVGTAPVGVNQVTDQTGVTTDGVYLYTVVQQDVAGNVSNYSMAISVTIDTSTPPSPTISLLMADDSGLPSHPNVTNVTSPRFVGTAAYNSTTNFPLDILAVTGGNLAGGIVVASSAAAANGTYLAQIKGPVADGTYTLVARTTNLAGTFSYSAPLTVTIKAFGPQVVPTLAILPVDDTGLKGDGVTSNHVPRFTGRTDPGDTVTLYALINGRITGPQAVATASTINGSFTFSLPFNLTNGSTQLVAQTSDIANNKGPLSPPFTVRIVTTTGDYYATGAAQLTVFDPNTETYIVRNAGSVQVDTTPGRDVPVQYDDNGDGRTDLIGYRFNTAEYYGRNSDGTPVDQQYGAGNSSLPVSGTFGGSGTFIFADYQPSTATWTVALPQAGGEVVKGFGVPNIDVPVPAAYDGNGVAEIAYFRPSSSVATDADSFTVMGPNGAYRVGFANTALSRFGFTYKAGDLPAPADYDGIGKDEFAIYRPSTGQFFILKAPDVNNPSTWSIRTVTLNLPGGPNVNDVPASEDYDGNGKADTTVYRPSNSTFYLIHSSTGLQENIQFGTPGGEIAAAGPLLYRLTALKGKFASSDGYKTLGTGVSNSAITGGIHALSFASAAHSSTSSGAAVPSMVAVAAPIALTTSVPATATATAPTAATAAAPKSAVIVGASTPKLVATAPATVTGRPAAEAEAHRGKVAPKAAKQAAKALVVDSRSHAVEASPLPHHPKAAPAPAGHRKAVAVAAALQHVVKAKKGRGQS